MSKPHRRRHLLTLSAGLVAFSLVISACGSDGAGTNSTTNDGTQTASSDNSDSPPGGGATDTAIKLAIPSGSLECIDPSQTNVSDGFMIGRAVVDSLVDIDDDDQIVPWLATSWEVSDDLKSFTFTLRDDATFSDGSKVDAEAVKATFDAIKNTLKERSPRGALILANFKSATAVDPTTVRLDFNEPSSDFLIGATTQTFGIVSLATSDKSADERCTDGVIGSGSYVMTGFELGQSLDLDRRDGYQWASAAASHEGEAEPASIHVSDVGVASVRAGGVASGEVDIATGIAMPDLPTIEGSDATLISSVVSGVPVHALVNISEGVTRHPEVRAAISDIIDRQVIAEKTLGPAYKPATSVFTPATYGYTDLSEYIKSDVAGAEKSLTDAGWQLGADNVRAKDGESLTLTITYTQDFGEFYETMATLMQQQLAAAGISATLRAVTGGTIIGMEANGEFDLLLTSIPAVDPMVAAGYIGGYVPGKDQVGAAGYFDRMADAASTLDEAAQVQAYEEMQRLTTTDYWLIPIVDDTSVGAFNNGTIADVKYLRNGALDLYTVSLK